MCVENYLLETIIVDRYTYLVPTSFEIVAIQHSTVPIFISIFFFNERRIILIFLLLLFLLRVMIWFHWRWRVTSDGSGFISKFVNCVCKLFYDDEIYASYFVFIQFYNVFWWKLFVVCSRVTNDEKFSKRYI